MDLVSMIVPVYNAEAYIGACIESIQKQSYQNIEILLIDDGSEDGSAGICDQYQREDGRIKVFHRENHGVSASRNYGIEHSLGDFIQFVDADDSLEPDTVAENLRLVKETGAELVFFSFRYHLVDEGRVRDNAFPESFAGNAEEFFEKYFITFIDRELMNPPWNKLIAASLLRDGSVRFQEEYSICEDMAFSTELLDKSNRIAFNPQMHYHYNLKSAGSLVFRFHENYFEALSYYYGVAMRYCERFANRAKAVQRLDTSFAALAIMHMKQISLYDKWSKKQKADRIKRISQDRKLLHALENARLNKKKRVIGFLIKHGMYAWIYRMYLFQKKLLHG